jgi:hypothetical protein
MGFVFGETGACVGDGLLTVAVVAGAGTDVTVGGGGT